MPSIFATHTVLNASHRVCLKEMATSGNESIVSRFSELSDIEDYDRTSDSSSVFHSSPEPQQVGSPQTDQNLSKAVYHQMKVTSIPSRKRGASSTSQQNDDNRKKACSQRLMYFNEMIVYTRKIESRRLRSCETSKARDCFSLTGKEAEIWSWIYNWQEDSYTNIFCAISLTMMSWFIPLNIWKVFFSELTQVCARLLNIFLLFRLKQA